MQFAYTADRTGFYVAPTSTVLVQSVVVEGEEIFPYFFMHLRKLYPGAYAPSTLGPGPDYSVALTGQEPERRESNRREEG